MAWTTIAGQVPEGSGIEYPGERRNAPRKMAALDGQIIWVGLFQPLSCKILDITDQGLKLETLRSARLPDVFELIVPSENSIVAVRLVWRDDLIAGVQLIQAPRAYKPSA